MYLNCKSYFSLHYGTFSTEDLVKKAAELGISCLALTNINNTSDAWDFVDTCRQQQIKPLLGAEIRNGNRLLYILLAANHTGFAAINCFLSEHLLEHKDFPVQLQQSPFEVPGDGFIIYPWGAKDWDQLASNERIGLRISEISKLYGTDLKKYGNKLVIRHPVTFLNKTYYNVHRLLRAIDQNVLLSKLPADTVAAPDETFLTPNELLHAFRDYPWIVTNTYRLMDDCQIDMDFSTDKNKKTFAASEEDDRILLKKLAMDGLQFRYGNKNKIAKQRVLKELQIIDDLQFSTYFLITWDLIRYAQSRGFYHVGRGSGANSVVAYCLQITDVDPIELNLYFERFLNPERTSPPDFDIDFSWLDRDEVIDYIFKRYGKKHVALLGMVTTFQYRAVVRELGKVFGLPKEEIDQLAHKDVADDKIHRMILQYGMLIKDFPNHLSIHPGGILISEKPITDYTAIFMPPKGFATAQLDMFVAEQIGLYKLDILSQRGLGHIKESLRLIRQNHHIDISIHDVETFKKDPAVRANIKKANTIGCFYIESPAMRQLLKKLECDDYITLVAASSIIRPGVAQSGMMKEYIYRYHNPTAFEYLHPMMKELMEETFGVMVFQEDVIKVAHYFAGLNLGEADTLRRAMSGKYRSNNRFQMIKEKFLQGCLNQGHPLELAAEIWRQMESFAGYSFNKAHSASYAVESFQSLYLKTYFPKEFMVAVINNFGGFYSTESYFIELRKTGATIHPPCINESDILTCIKGNDVYTGFTHIKSLEKELIDSILEEREMHGPFLHLQDFIERTHCSKEQLNLLVCIGAFRFTGKLKKQLLWEANFLQAKHKLHVPASESLFNEPPIEFRLPPLQDDPMDDRYDEMELLEFPLSNPFDLVEDDPNQYVFASDFGAHLHKTITVLAYYITYKPVRTISGKAMSFGTFIDARLDWIDTVHFPPSLEKYPLKGRGFYRITGKVVEDFGVYSLEVHRQCKVGYKERRYTH